MFSNLAFLVACFDIGFQATFIGFWQSKAGLSSVSIKKQRNSKSQKQKYDKNRSRRKHDEHA